MKLSLHEHPEGVQTAEGAQITYDLAGNEAHLGAARVEGPAVVFALTDEEPPDAALSAEVELDPETDWVIRCDRVDFPPGAVAFRHTHPGPGIRRLLLGELTIDAPGHLQSHGAGESWFEGADYPVLATASEAEGAAFVRVLLLPAEWAGKRTVRYSDPADDEKPKLQRATILLEEPLPRTLGA
jgi:quercetin dioxygenase-like cupin family protein